MLTISAPVRVSLNNKNYQWKHIHCILLWANHNSNLKKEVPLKRLPFSPLPQDVLPRRLQCIRAAAKIANLKREFMFSKSHTSVMFVFTVMVSAYFLCGLLWVLSIFQDYTTPNYRLIDEWWNEKYLEGNSCDIIYLVLRHLSGGTEEYH
jgi:hypothetical protein